MARWVVQLANFQYKIIHWPGKLHSNADALSRLPAFLEKIQQLGQNPSQGVIGVVSPKICAVQEALPSVVSGQEGELDELSQAQMDELSCSR